jgi:hypothetical protein
MSSLAGDDQDWRMSGYGVLGTADSTRTLYNPYGDIPTPIVSFGVWGLLGDGQSIKDIVDFGTSFENGLPIPAAIGARNATTDQQGVAVFGEMRRYSNDPNYPGQPAATVDTQVRWSGFIAGKDPINQKMVGVYGDAPEIGVMGHCREGHGVRGETNSGAAIVGQSNGSGLAGDFHGAVRVDGPITASGNLYIANGIEVEGDITVSGDLYLANKDICERFPIRTADQHAPGTVMVLHSNGQLVPCNRPYDKTVIGVVSGAGTSRPAITLGHQTRSSVAIALAGTAYCQVDADHAPIEMGDMLTTSPTVGYAMKVMDTQHAPGAVIGKALGTIARGKGLIPMLIALQ